MAKSDNISEYGFTAFTCGATGWDSESNSLKEHPNYEDIKRAVEDTVQSCGVDIMDADENFWMDVFYSYNIPVCEQLLDIIFTNIRVDVEVKVTL